MKNAGFIICLLSISIMACGDSISAIDVPSVVLNSFKSKFPAAVEVEWEKVDSLYQAEFKLASTNQAVRISSDGSLTIQKKEIGESNLPVSIKKLLKENFYTSLVDDVEWIEKDGRAYYQVELETDGQPDKKLVLTTDGIENPSIPYWD